MSKFLDDLQRWTEAQVAALLRGRIGAKRKDYIAAEINKLLRDRINDPLTIKVGDKVLAEFLRNQKGTSFGSRGTWTMETGYMDVLGVGIYTIYLESMWAAYYSRPAGVTVTSFAACGHGVVGYEDVPSLDSDLSYQTFFESRSEPPSVYAPERYTGLARLLMQGLRGANLAFWTRFSSLVGSGFSASPANLGVIRSPSGVYWMIHASIDGVLAVKLKLHSDLTGMTPCREHNLNDQRLSQLVDSVILGYSVPDGSVIELLDDEDVYDAYHNEDEDVMETLGWGWAWRYQQRGSDDEYVAGAVIVTLRETGRLANWRLHYALSTLEFGWNVNGIPSCAITVAEASKFMPPGAHRLGTTDGVAATLWRFVPPPAPGDPYWADGVVAAWYQPDGELKEVRYSGASYSSTHSGTTYAAWASAAASLKACGESDSDFVTASESTVLKQATWYIDGYCSETITSEITGNYSATLTLSAAGNTSPFGFAASPSQFQQCDGSQVNGYFWTDGRPYGLVNVGWVKNQGTLTYDVEITIVSQSNPIRHMVLGVSPGVVWWIQNGQVTTTKNTTGLGYRTNISIGSGGLCGDPSGKGAEVSPGWVGYAPSYVTSAPYYTTDTTTDESGQSDLAGSVLANAELSSLSANDALIVADAIAYSTVFLPGSDVGLASIISYHALTLAHGVPIPDGMSAIGATEKGIWIGGA